MSLKWERKCKKLDLAKWEEKKRQGRREGKSQEKELYSEKTRSKFDAGKVR